MNEQVLIGLGAGLSAGLVTLAIGLLKKSIRCPGCGEKLPKFSKPQNKEQALYGGRTCPKCNSEIDRNGQLINRITE